VLPLAFNLEGVKVLVVGAGHVGAHKAAQCLASGARVSVIATAVTGAMPTNVDRFERRAYVSGDLEGFSLVIAATGNAQVNDQIVNEAKQRGLWLNVVDDPLRSNFYFMALLHRGEVTVAVTTSGASPALSQELRDRVAAVVPEGVAHVAAVLRAERQELHDAGVSTEGIDWRHRVRQLLGEADC